MFRCLLGVLVVSLGLVGACGRIFRSLSIRMYWLFKFIFVLGIEQRFMVPSVYGYLEVDGLFDSLMCLELGLVLGELVSPHEEPVKEHEVVHVLVEGCMKVDGSCLVTIIEYRFQLISGVVGNDLDDFLHVDFKLFFDGKFGVVVKELGSKQCLRLSNCFH